jgi:FkbM family methyltransferase
MSKISYSQNSEDIILARVLSSVENGFYVDVGAADAKFHSVTKFFYDLGWSGINIEPNFELFKTLREQRPRDINLNIGISNFSGELKFVELPNTGLSTFDTHIGVELMSTYSEAKESPKRVDSLVNVLNEYLPPGQEIHFLKIDVEGHEDKVINSMNFKSHRPWILIVESTLPGSQVENFDRWEQALFANSYQFSYADGLNRFYIAIEHRQLQQYFKYPPNIFDGFETSELMDSRSEILRLLAEIENLHAWKLEVEHSLLWKWTSFLRKHTKS